MKRLPLRVVALRVSALFVAGVLTLGATRAPHPAPAAPSTTTVADDPADGRKGDLPGPNSALSPGDVVRLQLEALANNDEPFADAGIRTAYNFTSPSNRAATGDFARFTEMVRNPVYRDLIGNQHVRYGRVEVEGDVARQAVVLVTEDAYRVGYVFVLARQDTGECVGCWLAESVTRFEVEDPGSESLRAQPVVQI